MLLTRAAGGVERSPGLFGLEYALVIWTVRDLSLMISSGSSLENSMKTCWAMISKPGLLNQT
jgi:hypothetical protein